MSITSFRFFWLLLAALVAASSSRCVAQQAPPPPPVEDPLSQEILRRATQSPTPEQQGRAIRQAATIGRLDLAGSLLEGLAATADQAGFAEAGREIGSVWLLRLRTSEAISDVQREIVGRIQSAVASEATDPAALDQLIQQLRSGADGRAAALERLRSGGDAAIARLVTSLMAEPPSDPSDPRVAVLRRFGTAAAPALEQVLLYGDPTARPPLLESLQNVAGGEAIPFALAAYYSPTASEALRQTAHDLLAAHLGGIPTRREAEDYLAGRLRYQLGMLERAANTPGASQTAWFFADDGTTVDYRQVNEQTYFGSRAAAAAERLRLFGPADDAVVLDAIAADIGYRMQADPLFGSAADLTAVDARWQLAGGVTPQRLEQLVWPREGVRDAPLSPHARAAAIRLLGASGRPEIVASAGPVPAPLVHAAIAGDSDAIRWEAAAAIAQLDPQRPFLGAAGVLELWQQIASAPTQPRALIVENLINARSRAVLWVESLGYSTVPTGSGRAAIAAMEDTAGFELVLIGPDPVDISVVELLDRIRRRPGGREVPVLLYNTPPESAPADRWNAPLAAAASVESARDLALRVRQLMEQRSVHSLSQGDRTVIRETVSQMLERIEQNPRRYPAFSANEHSVTIPPAVRAPASQAEK